MKLCLGVEDSIPYDDGENTHKVAGYLEKNYGIMGLFYDQFNTKIAGLIEADLCESLENRLNGVMDRGDLFADSMQEIETTFRHALDSGFTGIVTKAAMMRVSKRFKSKRKKGVRPSFIDTGLYQASFRAWIR